MTRTTRQSKNDNQTKKICNKTLTKTTKLKRQRQYDKHKRQSTNKYQNNQQIINERKMKATMTRLS
jgi:hypothetical protein